MVSPHSWLGRSIVQRTALSALTLTAFVVGVVGALSFGFMRHLIQEGIEARLDNQAQLLAERVGLSLDAVAGDVAGLAANSLVVNGLVDSGGRVAYLQPFLQDRELAIPIRYTLALTDFAGQMLAAHGTVTENTYLGSELVSRAINEASSGAKVVPGEELRLRLAQPVVYPATGQSEGALVLELSLRDVVKLVQELLPNDLQLSLFQAGASHRVTVNPLPTADTLSVTKMLPLAAPLDSVGLRLEISIDRSQALAPVERLSWIYLLVGVSTLIVAWLLSRRMSRSLTQPLIALSNAVDRVTSQATLDIRIPVVGHDEVSRLAEAFARMVNRVRETQENLEDLVVDRTRALRETEKRLKTVFDNVVDAIITLDNAAHIEDFNKGAEQLFGISHAQAHGRPITDLVPEIGPIGARAVDYDAPPAAMNRRRELAGRRQDGSMFPAELSLSECQLGDRVLYVALIRDITERRRVDKLKNEFVSTVSHELRTPLTAIRGALSLISGGVAGQLSGQATSLLNIASNNTQRLLLLINDILDIEKIESGKMAYNIATQPLRPLVQQAIAAMAPYGEPLGVTFSLAGDGDDMNVSVDPDRLTQVLSNLLSNAAKFSPRGGNVEVDITRSERGARVCVRDHGPGIPEGFRDKIFRKFSQADSSDTRQKGGTGLGLAISKAIIEHFGGQIGFADAAGGGTVFYFDLPLVARATGQGVASEKTEGAL